MLTVTVEPQNFPPTVDAGVDQEITLPDDANLSATVSDDGLPDGTLDTLWSKVSGPGTVTFGDASAAVTTASFSEAGTYELKITADDGELSMEDGLTVLVHPGNDVVIDNSDAEVEGSWNNSSYQAGYYGTDYLFTESGSGADKVRWRPILVGGDYNVYYWLPDGMSTRSTEAQYTVYFNGGSKTYLVNQQAVGGRWILLGTHSFLPGTGGYVELTDNNTAYYTIADAIKFECSGVCDGNVLEQVSGVSAVPADGQVNLSWSPVSGADGYYVRIGTSSDVYSDPVNVGAVTEYTVGDLTHGQTYYFRVSAYNTREEGPASEEISVDLPELNVVPEVDAGADQEITLPDAAGLSATINDDGLPSGMLEILWSKVSGPGTVTFGDASVEATTASFSESGTYELKITVDDGELIADDMLVVIVNPALQEITIIYTYDDLNRLEQVDRPTQTIRYDYDEVGNINAKSIY
ncbi:MAG: PKD domain-containing protein [Candidatus Omnitrophota bacterium]